VHRFYAPDLAFDRDVELPEDEAHHLARVLRLKPGDLVAVFDGRGVEAAARVESLRGKRVVVRAVERKVAAAEPAVALTLAQAILKSDKMDGVIRDAVMLGVAAIQPLVSVRTEVPKAALRELGARHTRWERTVISSVKQCGRAVVPPVMTVCNFSDVLPTARDSMCLMFVEPHREGASALTDIQTLEHRVPAKATMLIGPEGGWDPVEIDLAEKAGVLLVTLGARTLRADAAGAIATAVMQYVWKDL